MRLGYTVKNIRAGNVGVNQDKGELEELGFVWDNSESEWSERIMPALEAFYRIKEHCRVPAAFVVPSDESWPAPSWGLKLGNVVGGIRCRGYYSAQVVRDKDLLDELGFELNVREVDWSTRILPALEAFYRVRGHCRVPYWFVVPSESSWPNEAHGLKLGAVVNNIRSHGNYFDQIARAMERLEAIEFNSKIAVSKWKKRVEPLLVTFEQLHGHRNVPRDFVIPSTSIWEEKDWGVQLGKLQPRKG